MNVEGYLERQYPYPPCWALVSDVYAREFGHAVPAHGADGTTIQAITSAFRRVLHAGGHGFRQVDAPLDMCVVLMGRRAAATPHHCGVYYGGKVLHALPGGTVHQDMASLSDVYEKIEFWAKE